jgi:general secretion pathway protein C
MSKYFQTAFNLLALAIVIFLVVELFYMIVRKRLSAVDTRESIVLRLPDVKRDVKPSLDYYKMIMTRNIFGSQQEASSEGEEEVVELQPTTLKLSLLGTVSGDQNNAFAVIEETSKKKQGLYRVGDSIQGALVKRILRGKVVLRVKDRDEMLTIEEAVASRMSREPVVSQPIEKEAAIMVSRADVEESIKNVHQLLSQVRVRPHFRDGKADGLWITNIKAGSLFERLGLRNGDIVQGIDGRIIKTPDDALEVYKRFRLGSSMALQIKRNNEQQVIHYTFR